MELGARFGTWGMRALSAWRALGAPGAARFIGIDISAQLVGWMRAHAAANGFAAATVALEGAAAYPSAPTHYTLRDAMRAGNVSRIDFLDLDIQGSEDNFFSNAETRALMESAVVVAVHIGTHTEAIHAKLRQLFAGDWGWTTTMNFLINPHYATCDAMVVEALQTNASCNSHTPWGPVYIRDGLLGFVNPRFVSRANIFVEEL